MIRFLLVTATTCLAGVGWWLGVHSVPQTRFVSTDGDDAQCTDNAQVACATIEHALQVVGPSTWYRPCGGKVVVACGHYNDTSIVMPRDAILLGAGNDCVWTTPRKEADTTWLTMADGASVVGLRGTLFLDRNETRVRRFTAISWPGTSVATASAGQHVAFRFDNRSPRLTLVRGLHVEHLVTPQYGEWRSSDSKITINTIDTGGRMHGFQITGTFSKDVVHDGWHFPAVELDARGGFQAS